MLPEEIETALEETLNELDEAEELSVAAWRTDQFDRLGFSTMDAAALGCMTEVHSSYVQRMLERGWTHEQCVLVLL